MSDKKLDIFKQVLPAIDTCDKQFYSKLSESEKKSFSAWLIMRWVSYSKNNPEHYLLMVNDIVNNNFTALTKHPELQWQLLALCGIGKRQSHQFIKPGRKKGKNKVQEELSKIYPKYKLDELELIEKIHTKAELKEIFIDAGYPDKEIANLL